jgi:hypothetical protein
MEAFLQGGVKAHIGASQPDRLSLNLDLDGGIKLNLGGDKNGNAIDVTYRAGVKHTYAGASNNDQVALSQNVQGTREEATSGDHRQVVQGNKTSHVSGKHMVRADQLSQQAINAFNGNYGSLNMLVSGKTSGQYADAVEEKVVKGGRKLTILAGGLSHTLPTGDFTQDVLTGKTTFACKAGDYKVDVGVGGVTIMTKSGAYNLATKLGNMSLEATAGTVSMKAGLSMTLTAKVSCTIEAAMVNLGKSSASLGVCRGTTALPEGSPTLDPITGAPLLGSALIRSI